MKHAPPYIAWLGCLLLCASLHAQQGDTMRVHELLTKADALSDQQKPEAALPYLREALRLMEQQGRYEARFIRAAISAGEIMVARFDPEEGIIYLRKALELAQQQGGETSLMVGDATFGIAKYYHSKKDRVTGNTYFDQSMRVYQAQYGSAHPAIGYIHWNKARFYYQDGEYERAAAALEKGKTAFEESETIDSLGMAKLYNLGGVVLSRMGDHVGGLAAYARALEIWQNALGEDHSNIGFGYNNIGLAYIALGEYHNALEYLTCAVKAREEMLGDASRWLTQGHNNLGLCYKYMGDLDNAQVNYEKALDIRLKTYGPDHASVGTSYHNIAGLKFLLGEEEEAIELYEKALAIRKQALGPKHPLIADQYEKLGEIYAGRGEARRALDLYQLALPIREAKLGPLHPDILRIRVRMAAAWGELGDSGKQFEQLEWVRGQQEDQLGQNHPALAATWQGLGTYYRQQGAWEQAVGSYQAALIANSHGFLAMDWLANPSWEQAISAPLLLSLLEEKAALFLEMAKQANNPDESLLRAHKTYIYADQFVSEMRRNLTGKASREAISQASQSLYEGAIETALRRYRRHPDSQHLEQIFEWMEKSKQQLLRESLQVSHALRFSGVPIPVIEREYALRQQKAYWENRLYKEIEAGRPADELTLTACRDQLYRLSIDYQAHIRMLEQTYPQYYQLKYDSELLSLSALQDWAQSHQTAVLSYFSGEEHLYVLAVSGAKVQVEKINNTAAVEQEIRQFLSGLKNAELADAQGNSPEVFSSFSRQAHHLYSVLIAPVFTHPPSHLTIIPDGLLGYLPMGILLPGLPKDRNRANYGDLDYVMRNSAIQYAFSASLLVNRESGILGSEKGFAGFAPGYGSPDMLASSRLLSESETASVLGRLVGNSSEVKEIAKVLQGDAFTGTAATESRFKALAPEYGILHLAMHTVLNDQNPLRSAMVFTVDSTETEDGWLHASEIYSLRIPAQFIALSACETGGGKLKRGEGIMSLARAFRFAGCPNILTSLWQADDQATTTLMKGFYQNLREGMPKAKALQQAKLSYLETSGRSHPHYWAAFVLLGDEEPIQIAAPVRGYVWLLVGLMLILVVGIGSRIKGREQIRI